MNTELKIITWNCRGAFRKKQIEFFEEYLPDLCIIQECEDIRKFNSSIHYLYKENCLWFGNNSKKGIAIFSKQTISFSISSNLNSKYEYIIPIELISPVPIQLFAIWAMKGKKENKRERYIAQVYKALDYYNLKSYKNCIILGDFNWNINFDKNSYSIDAKFSDFLKLMDSNKFLSLYHHYTHENFGEETTATFYMYKNKDKAYHIDYVFISESLRNNFTSFKIADYDKVSSVSDHTPLISKFIF